MKCSDYSKRKHNTLNLNLKYSVKANDELDLASEIEINLIEVEADDTGFKIDGKQLVLKGLRKTDEDHEAKEFFETFEKSIETPDIVLEKYKQMKEK